VRGAAVSAFDDLDAEHTSRRRRGKRPKPKRSLRQRLLLLAIWIAAAAAGLAAGVRASEPVIARLRPEVLAVRNVAVVGAERAPAAEIVKMLGLTAGTPVLAIDAPELVRRIESHPWVAHARVTLLRPGRILVAVEERQPVAIALLGNPPTRFWLDTSGTPFLPVGTANAKGKLAVLGPEDAAPLAANPRFAEGVSLAAALERHGIRGVKAVQVARAAPEELPALELESGARVALGAGEHEAKLERLAALLRGRPAEAAAAREIDLRFGDRMVLRGGPTSSAEAGDAEGSGGSPPSNSGPRG
jgi:cell division septal protein FtsQ